ncbi:hypothetical protein [Gluconobacter japonicus]|uniref:hypothetical protein n=1 Tax=Gluconobacter japonicus TaxID=376620 RepID=UPI0007843B59|nr:hypothetical protein [Gluconobacter japonicus]KXV20610.1 hypothetical protein AD935_11010 [Gluconobacter japonicus]
MNESLKQAIEEAKQAHRERPPLYGTYGYFNGLPDYSCSFPTGTTPGKRWRRQINIGPWGQITIPPIGWVICEYYEDPELPEGRMGIRYYRPVIRVPVLTRERGV